MPLPPPCLPPLALAEGTLGPLLAWGSAPGACLTLWVRSPSLGHIGPGWGVSWSNYGTWAPLRCCCPVAVLPPLVGWDLEWALGGLLAGGSGGEQCLMGGRPGLGPGQLLDPVLQYAGGGSVPAEPAWLWLSVWVITCGYWGLLCGELFDVNPRLLHGLG